MYINQGLMITLIMNIMPQGIRKYDKQAFLRPSYKYLSHPLMSVEQIFITADWMKTASVTVETELDWLLPERELD